MIETIKVSSRGQIVIPEQIRKNLNIKEGTKLILIERRDKLIIELEESFLKKLKENEKLNENINWLRSSSFHKIWDNEKDDVVWEEYL